MLTTNVRVRCVLIAGWLFAHTCLGLIASAHADDRQNAVPACSLALVLAVDISPSVNDYEYKLQMAGFASAFRHPDLITAISFAGRSGILVTVVLWSAVNQQTQVVGWTRVHDASSSKALADAIKQVPRPLTRLGMGTAIGAAMIHAAKLFAQAPSPCLRRVIDISGDGRSNVGPKPDKARDVIVETGITINGLAIVSDEPDLNVYYRDHVIGGSAAFVMTAATHEAFDVAIRKKLLREILPRMTQR